jgi:hypothetical protein
MPGVPAGAAPPDVGTAKIMRGCGGCGCAFALLAFLGGSVLIGFGMQRATKEALPFGIILTPLSLLIAVVSGVLLYLGITRLKKASGR